MAIMANTQVFTKEWAENPQKIMHVLKKCSVSPKHQNEIRLLLLRMATSKLFVERPETEGTFTWAPKKGLEFSGHEEEAIAVAQERKRKTNHSEMSECSKKQRGLFDSTKSGNSSNSDISDNGSSDTQEDNSSNESRCDSDSDSEHSNDGNHSDEDADHDGKKNREEDAPIYEFKADVNVNNDEPDCPFTDSKLSCQKPGIIQVGDRLDKKICNFCISKGEQKGKYRGTFFGTVVEVQCNFIGEPTKIIVERDSGETETHVENNDGKPTVKEAVSQREKYLKKGYKIDDNRRKEAMSTITKIVEEGKNECPPYKINTEIFVNPGRDKVIRETSDSRTSFFATVMGSCAHFITKAEGFDSGKVEHKNMLMDLALIGSLSSSMDPIVTVLFETFKNLNTIGEFPSDMLTFYTDGCYSRNLNPAGGEGSRFNPLNGKKDSPKNVFELAKQNIDDCRESMNNILDCLTNLKESYDVGLEVEKDFIDDSGLKQFKKGKILSFEDGLYKVQFELSGRSFCCKMSSKEVEHKLSRKDLGYKALNRSDVADYTKELTEKINGINLFRSVFAMQLIGVVHHTKTFSKRAWQQLTYEKVAKGTAPANLALRLGVSSTIYEEVENNLVMPHEVVVNLACEKTRDKKKKDLFPLGGIMFHTGSDGYQMGNVVRQKGAPLSRQVLQKAANACKDVVLGIDRLLVGDTFLDGKTLLVGENLDLSAMYYENIRSAVGSDVPFHEKSNAICKAFVEACVLVKPTFVELSNRESNSFVFKDFDSFLAEKGVFSNEPVALVSVGRNQDVDIDFSSGDNQMHASSFIYKFAKTGAKLALVTKVMERFPVDKTFIDKHKKNIQNSLESWLDGEKGIEDWLKTERTALDLVSLAKENKTSIDDVKYISAVGKLIEVLANDKAVDTWKIAERELLLEMKVEINKEFTGSSICKVQDKGSPCYYQRHRKGYLDQLCCIDEAWFFDIMLASNNEEALRGKVKPFSTDKVLRRRWQTISFNPRTLIGQPSTLVIPTKSKEEMQEFLELLKSFPANWKRNVVITTVV